MTTRKSAIDYKKELQELQQQQKALENRITKRFQTLCKAHPDVPLYQVGMLNDKNVLSGWFINESPVRVPVLTTSIRLKYIETIEKFLADQHPHKQTNIEFPEERITNEQLGVTMDIFE
jgi:hypothetical protein